MAIPIPFEREHEKLQPAIGKGNRTGDAAGVASTAPFLGEEESALPPLGLSTILARSDDVETISAEDAGRAVALAHHSSSAMPRKLGEHQKNISAPKELTAAARDESHAETMGFGEI